MSALHETGWLEASGDAPGEADGYVFPLSPQQLRLWHAHRANPGTGAYNGAFRHELTGPLDAGRLERALNTLVARHEMLRASCRVFDGAPKLFVAENLRLPLGIVDLRALPVPEREARMEQLCGDAARHAFDLAHGPLIRVGLIRMEAQRSVFTLTLHNMICDGWSIGQLVDELHELYAALLEGRTPGLAPLEIQFGDYAVWLEEHFASPHVAEQVEFWRKTLADYRRLDVAPNLVPGNGEATDSDIVARDLAPELAASLKAFAAAHGGTMFTTALTACVALLHRDTGRDDISVGTPVAGRNRPEFERLVGPLLNHVILRTPADGNPTFRELEARVRDTVLDGLANQDVPLEHVADALAAEGAPLPDPAYSISFVSQRAFAGGSRFVKDIGGVHMRTLPSKSQGALYDLFFFLIERETGWRLSLEYRTGCFSKARAQHLLDGLCAVLAQGARTPDTRLSQLALTRWAVAAPEPAIEALVPVLAESYDVEHLDCESPGPDRLPASFAQERFWLLHKAAPASATFNMPACLRIGGPLDARRLERSLQTLAARHESLRTAFAEDDGGLHQVIAADVELRLHETSLEGEAAASRETVLAEAMRTECGQPFALDAAPLVRARLFRLDADDHLLVLTLHHIIADGQSFANLQRELWAIYDALGSGREAALPELAIQYGDFAAWQREWAASDAATAQLDYWKGKLANPLPVLDFPLDRAPTNRQASGSRTEIAPIPPALMDGLRRLGQRQNATLFAVTSAAFAALLARYARQTDVLFGCPVANRTAETAPLIGPFAGPMAVRLDLGGDPTLDEIVVRARDATFDALDNTELPFEQIMNAIDARSVKGRTPLFQFYFLYQTAFLQAHRAADLAIAPVPAISAGTPYELQLALIDRPDGVVAQLEYSTALFDADTIRGVLAYFLDVLGAFVARPDQPLSALPMPATKPSAYRMATASDAPARAYRAPGTGEETRLAAIWERLLRRAPISIDDDFFDLGGQSILAARLVVEVVREFGVRIDVSTIAFARTIALLAALIATPDSGRLSPRLVPLRTSGHKRPLFLVHCGGGHVLRYQDLVAGMPRDQPIYGLSAPALDGGETSPRIEDLAKLYVAEIRSVQPHGPYQIGGYSFGGLVAYEMAAQLADAGQQVDLLAILDTANRTHYARLPIAERLRMQVSYAADRTGRYMRLLRAGSFDQLKADAKDAVVQRAQRLGRALEPVAPRKARAQSGDPLPDTLALFTVEAERYVPRPYPGRVLVLFAEDRGAEWRANPSLGWSDVAHGGVETRFVPGDHQTFIKQPHVATLIAHLLEYQAKYGQTGHGSAG